MSLIKKALHKHDMILMEGAVIEILRRSGEVSLHPDLIHTQLIYDSKGVEAFTLLFDSYIEVAKNANIPYIMCAPTWRANKENVDKSGVKNTINRDAVNLVDNIRLASGSFTKNIIIGGTIGPKNDCYTPELGLSSDESETFHAWQIEELAQAGVDFVIAETVPTVSEALGMARAASKLNIDCIISFVSSREGKVLDHTSLLDAISFIDSNVANPPVGYSVSCAYPSFLCADTQPQEVLNRLVAFKGNASSLNYCELENADTICIDDISDWGDRMLQLNREYGIQILGGCCGTDALHLDYLINH